MQLGSKGGDPVKRPRTISKPKKMESAPPIYLRNVLKSTNIQKKFFGFFADVAKDPAMLGSLLGCNVGAKRLPGKGIRERGH